MDPSDIAESVADTFIEKIEEMLSEIYTNENMSRKYTLEEFRKKYGI